MLCQCCSAGNVRRMRITAKKKPLLAGLNPTSNTLVSPSPPQGDGLSPPPSPPAAAAVPLHLFNHLPLPKILIPPRAVLHPSPQSGGLYRSWPRRDTPAAGDAPAPCSMFLAEKKCPLRTPRAARGVQELRNWNRLNNGSRLLEENEICPRVTENLHLMLTAHYKEKVSETQQTQGAQLERAINSDSSPHLIFQSISAFAQTLAISPRAAARGWDEQLRRCRTGGHLSVQAPRARQQVWRKT